MMPILVLIANPLVIEIEAPKAVKSGEPFHVVASLVNRSKEPVVIVNPRIGHRDLGLSMNGGLYRQGQLVATQFGGHMVGQRNYVWTYGAWAFKTLKPGEKAILEDITYRYQYVAGKTPETKPELGTAPLESLPPTNYELRFSYAFERKLDPKREKPSLRMPAIKPEARELYTKTWTGRLEATAPVTVEPS